jgi:hypothetical protein
MTLPRGRRRSRENSWPAEVTSCVASSGARSGSGKWEWMSGGGGCSVNG